MCYGITGYHLRVQVCEVGVLQRLLHANSPLRVEDQLDRLSNRKRKEKKNRKNSKDAKKGKRRGEKTKTTNEGGGND